MFLYAHKRPNHINKQAFGLVPVSNTATFLKVMESKTALPANWNDIPKFKSDTSKWVYFFSNLTEEVWVQLKEILEADYRRQLHFQLLQDGISVSAGVEEAKVVSYINFLNFIGCSILSPSCILQTDTQNEQLSTDSLKVAS